MTTARRTPALLASILLGAALSLTACGARADPASPAAAGGPAPASPQDSCGGVGDLVKDHLRSPAVRSVVVQGQCTSVVVATDLADDDGAAATRLCDLAAEVAYSGDTNAVSVLAGSGRELAVGVAGAGCLAG